MDDLIRRQAAIDAINELPDCPNGFSDTYDKSCIIGVLEELPPAEPEWGELLVICDNCGHAIHVKRTDVKPIIEPSAQPERLTDDDFETIRIHLSAYKERLCNQHRWEEAEEYQRIIDRFMRFASAQPERKKMTNKEWLDFLSEQFDISRTSAREMLHGMMQCKKEDNYKKQFNRRWEQE